MAFEKNNKKQLKKEQSKKSAAEPRKVKSQPKRKATVSKVPKKKKTDDLNKCLKNGSIFKYINGMSYGEFLNPFIRKAKKVCVVNQFARFELLKTVTPFQRRVTYMAWHPTYTDIAVACSKFGEIALYNLSNDDESYYIEGSGPGGSIVGLKFHQDNPRKIFTASITGEISEVDLATKASRTLISTGCFENWYSSLDVCFERKIVLSGDCHGRTILMSTDGKKIWHEKLHKSKVTHVEFSPADPNIFVSSSIDHTVKLFDVRMASKDPFLVFNHEKGVNAARFSPSNRHSLLTTDQHSEIRVYKSHAWSEEIVIKHPHRQFQHITPIKAVWHPIEDVIVVGRYPDDNFLKPDARTIDFFDGDNGDILWRMDCPSPCISSLVDINGTSDAMMSSSSYSLCFFKDHNVIEENRFQKKSLKRNINSD